MGCARPGTPREKVLPKFHGTQQELDSALQMLFAFAITGAAATPQADTATDSRTWRVFPRELLCATLWVVGKAAPTVAANGNERRMLRRLELQGFMSSRRRAAALMHASAVQIEGHRAQCAALLVPGATGPACWLGPG